MIKRPGMSLPKDQAKTLKMARVGSLMVGRTVEAFEDRIVSHRDFVSKVNFLVSSHKNYCNHNSRVADGRYKFCKVWPR